MLSLVDCQQEICDSVRPWSTDVLHCAVKEGWDICVAVVIKPQVGTAYAPACVVHQHTVCE